VDLITLPYLTDDAIISNNRKVLINKNKRLTNKEKALVQFNDAFSLTSIYNDNTYKLQNLMMEKCSHMEIIRYKNC
jgi:hypothetical protein